jgi:F0F1-type ATP synthase assembly protein I
VREFDRSWLVVRALAATRLIILVTMREASSRVGRRGTSCLPGHRAPGFIVAIIIGGSIGWLASHIMKANAQMGLIANIVIGVVASVIGH